MIKYRGDKTLKPCPFCGGNARLEEEERYQYKSEDFPKWYIYCRGCLIRTPVASKPRVINMWNKRVMTAE